MRLKFKKQQYQTNAVDSVVDCFAGQPKNINSQYLIDPGKVEMNTPQQPRLLDEAGIKNAEIVLSPATLLENIHTVQRRQNLPLSSVLVSNRVGAVNLDIEMETGTGKTYCYIKTMFELNLFGVGL